MEHRESERVFLEDLISKMRADKTECNTPFSEKYSYEQIKSAILDRLDTQFSGHDEELRSSDLSTELEKLHESFMLRPRDSAGLSGEALEPAAPKGP